MTNKLYDSDWKLQGCEAEVLECRDTERGREVLLSDTVIFPAGGGQPSDLGSIGRARVLLATEEGENVWHLVEEQEKEKEKLFAGQRVAVQLDSARREDHCCQHTGEHIVSGLASKLFSAHNVGFHMAEDYSTLDLDLPLSAEQLFELELAANRAVRQNIPVRLQLTDAAGLSSLTLRKQAAGLAEAENAVIRIVWIDGVDSCTCCGTHCASTGEVGAIKLTASMKYKGGVRIWFACGERAVRRSREQQEALDTLARRFSVKEEDVVPAVLRQGDELNAARRELKKRTEELLNSRAAELMAAAKQAGVVRLVLYRGEGLGMGELKTLAEKLCKAPDVVALLFSSTGETACYQLARGSGVQHSMKELCTVVNGLLVGKGGGREENAQGSAQAASLTADALAQLEAYTMKVLGAK